MSNLPVMTIWPWSIRATAVNSTSPVSALVRRVMVAVRAIVPASFPPRYHTACCVMTSPAERPLRVLSMYEDFVVLLVKCRICGPDPTPLAGACVVRTAWWWPEAERMPAPAPNAAATRAATRMSSVRLVTQVGIGTRGPGLHSCAAIGLGARSGVDVERHDGRAARHLMELEVAACVTVRLRPSGDCGPEGLVLRLDEELPGERDLAVGELGHAVVEDLAGLLAGAEGDRRDELHGADLRSVPAPHGVLR